MVSVQNYSPNTRNSRPGNKKGKIDDPKCGLCRLENETLEHLFSTCVYSNQFWTQTFDWLFTTANNNIRINPNKFQILLGYNFKK